MQIYLLCSIKKKSLRMQYQASAKVMRNEGELYHSVFNMQLLRSCEQCAIKVVSKAMC